MLATTSGLAKLVMQPASIAAQLAAASRRSAVAPLPFRTQTRVEVIDRLLARADRVEFAIFGSLSSIHFGVLVVVTPKRTMLMPRRLAEGSSVGENCYTRGFHPLHFPLMTLRTRWIATSTSRPDHTWSCMVISAGKRQSMVNEAYPNRVNSW